MFNVKSLFFVLLQTFQNKICQTMIYLDRADLRRVKSCEKWINKIFKYLHYGSKQWGASFEYAAVLGKKHNLRLIRG